MRVGKWSFVFLIGLVLVACGRSKESQFYVLNPIPPKKQQMNTYSYLKIGIDEVNCPAYIEKPQLMIHYTPHQIALKEFHQWAEALNKNIMRVVETNLSTLLPGAVVESFPWDSKFKPNYHLQINIADFAIASNGSSILRAEYIIYHDRDLIEKHDVYYHLKLTQVTPEALVVSMNANLTCLTETIARSFMAGKYRREDLK
ncbi:membrane integrity-associated transporter subunit PqiC [Legionella donaldsonii]|uniref:PqiC family protein n=1 Tax=Legionella donaldsonii TaxID=45060 RepID=UPI00399D3D2D